MGVSVTCSGSLLVSGFAGSGSRQCLFHCVTVPQALVVWTVSSSDEPFWPHGHLIAQGQMLSFCQGPVTGQELVCEWCVVQPRSRTLGVYTVTLPPRPLNTPCDTFLGCSIRQGFSQVIGLLVLKPGPPVDSFSALGSTQSRHALSHATNGWGSIPKFRTCCLQNPEKPG